MSSAWRWGKSDSRLWEAQRRWRLTLTDDRRGLYRAERIDGCGLFDNRRYCD